MGELDSVAGKFHLANGGCPYPYHYRNGEISEIQMDTYPLGITQETQYELLEGQLMVGDALVFCSDGVAEAENKEGEQLGYMRASEIVVSACKESDSATRIVELVLESVEAFMDDAQQVDDITCLAVYVPG